MYSKLHRGMTQKKKPNKVNKGSNRKSAPKSASQMTSRGDTKNKKIDKNSKNSPKTTKKVTKTKDEIREQRIKNLTPGGPGRPKGVLNFKTRLNIALDKLADEFVSQHNKKHKKADHIKKEDVDIMGDIFMQYVNKARSGDLKAMDSLLDRAYGKATQKLEHTGKDGNPIEIEEKKKEAKKKIKSMMSKWVK